MRESLDERQERIEIVLADDHAMVRGGLRRVLDSQADLSVVAEAADVEAALRHTRDRQPRVVVLDLHMPGVPTLDAIPQFCEAAPGCAVLVLTMESEPSSVRRALSAGARGYVLKEAAEAELAVGSRFAGHRIDAILGRGGMGVVFRATDLMLDRTVALKLIGPEAARSRDFRARFERECRLAAAIDHPHVVEIFHAGDEGGLLYLTMRYVDGLDLRKLLRSEGRLEPARAVALLAQIASALDEAHRLGMVHRDVKPANVLIKRQSHGDHAFLTDFGLTKPKLEDSVTRTAAPLGTVDYVAPEQARGSKVDGRADVYSLGCVLFQMLTGDVVFDRDSDLDKLWAHVHEPPPSLLSVRPDLPRGLAEVLDRALAKDPAQRPQSAGELARGALAAVKP